jgi:hypothetical protein
LLAHQVYRGAASSGRRGSSGRGSSEEEIGGEENDLHADLYLKYIVAMEGSG